MSGSRCAGIGIVVAAALSAGCWSSDPTALDSDMLGTWNKQIVVAHFGLLLNLISEIDVETVPLTLDYEAPFGRYAVLTAKDGIVVALIASIPQGDNVALHMVMEARDLTEFRAFEVRWPFAEDDRSISQRYFNLHKAPTEDNSVEAPPKPPRKKKDDGPQYLVPPGFKPIGPYPVNILASGVDEDNWRLLCERLGGWPFVDPPEDPVVTVGGRTIAWADLKQGLDEGTVHGVVDIRGCMPEDRLPKPRSEREAAEEPDKEVKP